MLVGEELFLVLFRSFSFLLLYTTIRTAAVCCGEFRGGIYEFTYSFLLYWYI